MPGTKTHHTTTINPGILEGAIREARGNAERVVIDVSVAAVVSAAVAVSVGAAVTVLVVAVTVLVVIANFPTGETSETSNILITSQNWTSAQ